MSTEYKDKDGVLIVMPIERLDTGTAPEVDREVMARIDAGATKVVFDFERTSYVSSAGLRVVLKAAKTVVKGGGGVAVCRANSHIMEVLELSGFHVLIKVARTVDQAIAAL